MKMSKKLAYLACSAATAVSFSSAPVQAQADPYLGQVMYFGGNFCPRAWVPAEGQLLQISQWSALFSLFGTTYGGDGRTTFGIPDLRGRAAIGVGTGPGLSPSTWGQKKGTESFTLTIPTMPSHNHIVNASNDQANKNGPGTDFLAIPDLNTNIYHEGPATKQMDPGMISNTGGGLPVSKTSPSLGLMACVATEGVFPPRS